MDETLANGADDLPQIGLIAQYVKDFSFENPNAPTVYSWQNQPNIDVQFNIGSDKVADDVHEVAIKITVKAVSDPGHGLRGRAGLCRPVRYSATSPTSRLRRSSMPKRRACCSPSPAVSWPMPCANGGFPPLLLDPIDFGGLYAQQLQAQAAAQSVPAAGEACPYRPPAKLENPLSVSAQLTRDRP